MNLEIKARNNWIGIEGLPLSAWNVQPLRNISEACGGMLEILSETLDLSFLFFMKKINVRGFSCGSISSLLEIPLDDQV